jgi:hypothetical protein
LCLCAFSFNIPKSGIVPEISPEKVFVGEIKDGKEIAKRTTSREFETHLGNFFGHRYSLRGNKKQNFMLISEKFKRCKIGNPKRYRIKK